MVRRRIYLPRGGAGLRSRIVMTCKRRCEAGPGVPSCCLWTKGKMSCSGHDASAREVGCWHWRAEVPGDRDGAFASVLDVVGLTEEQVRCAGSELADLLRSGENQDVAP